MLLTEPPIPKEYIQFTDKEIENICIEKWSRDGKGVTIEDAKKVTEVPVGMFKDNQYLTDASFLKYFTNLDTFSQYFMTYCVNLKTVVFPTSIKETGQYPFVAQTTGVASITNLQLNEGLEVISYQCFYRQVNLGNVIIPSTVKSIERNAFSGDLTFIIKAEMPPTLETNTFSGAENPVFYVPDESVEAYKAATGWIDYADKIKPISEYIE